MSFNEDLEKTRIAERIAWDLMRKEEKTRSVIDVRDAPVFQDMDVDFIWEIQSRKMFFVEVKLDTKIADTGNIVYEKTTSGNIGCFEKTKASYIFYYDLKGKKMYVIDVSCLRKLVQESKFNLVKMGDNATGYLIKLDLLKTLGVIKKTYENME